MKSLVLIVQLCTSAAMDDCSVYFDQVWQDASSIPAQHQCSMLAVHAENVERQAGHKFVSAYCEKMGETF